MKEPGTTGRALFALAGILAGAIASPAQTRSSAHYAEATETFDAGGGRATSAHYTADTSTGALAGTASGATGFARHGFAGQLYDPRTLVVSATPSTLDERATRQLAVQLTLDDATTLAVVPSAPVWSVNWGPVSSVSPGGLVTAGTVYANTLASVHATHAGMAADVLLTVLNVNRDDYGTYAADELDDAWQVQFFGEGNPLASPTADPDGDGQNNRFEFTAGTTPNDASSALRIRIEFVPGQPNQKRIIVSPFFGDRLYALEACTNLVAGNWALVNAPLVNDSGNERAFTDTNTGGGPKFYRVQITRP